MRRICSWILTIALMLGLCACGQSAEAKWQEQYDLGMRYLSEGNYEEAIIAFTAAIEIDPKRPEGFIGRGDAYALSGDTEDNLSAAQVLYTEYICRIFYKSMSTGCVLSEKRLCYKMTLAWIS